MLNINIYSQVINLLIFILTGIIIGILFDIFRIVRKSFKTPDFITYIEDIIFWLLTGLILLFSIFVFNKGEIRIYIFIGLIFGMILYLLTISEYFIKISVKVLNFIKKILYIPIKFIFRVVYSFFLKIKHFVRNFKIKKVKTTKFPNIYKEINK